MLDQEETMTPEDEILLGRIFILYPLLFSVTAMCAFDLACRVWRVCRKHKGEFLA